jgi:hypothetical protein
VTDKALGPLVLREVNDNVFELLLFSSEDLQFYSKESLKFVLYDFNINLSLKTKSTRLGNVRCHVGFVRKIKYKKETPKI